MFADWLQLFESDAVAFNIEKQIEHSLTALERRREMLYSCESSFASIKHVFFIELNSHNS